MRWGSICLSPYYLVAQLTAKFSMSEQILTNSRFDLYFIDECEWFDIFDLVKKYEIKMSLVDYQVAYLAFVKHEPLLCFDNQITSFAKKLRPNV